MKRMLHVFRRTELAGALPIRKLTGRVRWRAGESKQSNFLVTLFKALIVTDLVAEPSEGLPERLRRLPRRLR
jgi:hypothetical protein